MFACCESQAILIELDYEVKEMDTIFPDQVDLVDNVLLDAKPDMVYPQKSMFKRIHTIQESVTKYE